MSDERRGCQAITQAQPTARVKLRKVAAGNSGWAIVGCVLDRQPGITVRIGTASDRPSLEHLFRGLAPNAAGDDNMPMNAMTATAPVNS